MKLFTTYFFSLFVFSFALAQVPVLVKDINPGIGSSLPQFDKGSVSWGGKVYFAASDGINGTELWVTDGTSAGTVLVKDIYPGASGSDCQNFFPTANFIFFTATDDVNGLELWRTDGTASGTQLIKDIRPGTANGIYVNGSSQPKSFFLWNNVLYFNANEGTNGVELWKSDGTNTGTLLVKNINTADFPSYPVDFEEYNGKLYFQGRSGLGNELWVTDGTTNGTVLVKDINTGSFSSNPSSLINSNGYLIFIADDDIAQLELWRSDGTTAGTVLVKDINPNQFGSGMQTSPNTFEKRLIKIGNTIYFSADDGGTNGTELWRSDGTETGTFMVLDARPGASGFTPQNFAVLNEILYYKYDDGTNGQELWRSDGTGIGTFMVKDIYPGTFGSFVLPTRIASVEGAIWFGAENASSIGNELWVSNGTGPGTALVANINPGSSDSYPFQFIGLPDLLLFGATGPEGTELWKMSLNLVPLSVVLTVTDSIVCHDEASGAILLNVQGGMPPYSYAWSPSSLQGANPTWLPAGTYSVTITDAAGATITSSIEITQPTALATATSSIAATYTNANGSASVSVTGGTMPYIYLWNNAPPSTTSAITNVVAGDYTVVVTDANGCTISADVTVNMVSVPLTIALMVTEPVACYGESTGALSLIVQGGLPPYSYAWSPSNLQGANPTGLTAGTYSVTATDAAGATITSTIEITQPTALATTASSIAATYSNANGSASVTVTGGTAPYTYLWNNTPPSTTAAINNVVAGDYTVVVTDANGCTISADVTVDMETGTNEAFGNSINVAPTLSNGQFMVLSNSLLTNMQLTLTDSQGRMVKHWENVSTGQSLSTDEPLNGAYFLRISAEGKWAAKMIVFRK